MHSNNCNPNFAKNDIDLKIYQCKEKVAKHPEESIPTIYKQTLVDIKDSGVDLICKIPSFTSVKSTLYNKRNNAVGMQKTCFKNVDDVIVPPRDQSFLLGDYCCENIRILVFCTDETRQLLKNIKHVFGDGTFRACPEPFMQIYTLHGDIGSSSANTNIIPMIYALMSAKTHEAYVALFEMIKSQIPDWSPTKFTSDFEQPSYNAMLTVFPKVKTKGCYYHFRNSIWRKCKNLQLVKNKSTRRIIALCAVLPLLPRDKIESGWSYIQEFVDVNDKKMCSLVSYMNKFWMKDNNFIDSWCVFGELHRTNNFIEGWHVKINNECRRKKATLLKILKVFKDDAALYSVLRTQIQNEVAPFKSRTRESILRDQHIQNTQMMLINGDISVGHYLEILR